MRWYSCAIHVPCSVIHTARDQCFTCIIHWCWHEMCSRIGCIHKLLWLWELNKRLFQVVEWSFYKDFLFLVKVQQVIPQWLLQTRTFKEHSVVAFWTQAHLTHFFKFVIFLCIPSTLRTLENVLKNNPHTFYISGEKRNLYVLRICLIVKLRIMTQSAGTKHDTINILMIGR